MPRKFFKRIMPNPEFIKNHRSLRFLGQRLHDPNLWHLNRHAVANACLVGMFAAFMPIPSQMLLAAVLALWRRANLPISVALVWLTNPVTMPPVLYAEYRLGAWVLQRSPNTQHFEPSFDWLRSQLGQIWEPVLVGSLILGIVSGLLAAGLVHLLWRVHVAMRWRARQRRVVKEK
jgi:uncharacterized protein (DUF2062 family)